MLSPSTMLCAKGQNGSWGDLEGAKCQKAPAEHPDLLFPPLVLLFACHGPPGKAKPLASPFSAVWLVAMPGLHATFSSSTHINADLWQNCSLLHSFEVASFGASQLRAQNQWAVLCPCLSAELQELGWGSQSGNWGCS